MIEEWFTEKLKGLKIDENRFSTLVEIRNRIEETADLGAEAIHFLLTSSEIYDCVEKDSEPYPAIVYINSDGEESEDELIIGAKDIVSDILGICMSKLTLRQKYYLYLVRKSLRHKNATIRAVAVNNILKELQREKDDDDLKNYVSGELLRLILLAMQDPASEVGTPAVKVLTIVLDRHLDNPSVKELLLNSLKQNSEIKCRLYELAVNLSKISETNSEKVEFILDHALSELDNLDTLVQLNILEILSPLSEQSQGFLYLEKRKALDVISKRADDIYKVPEDHLLIPGIMTFFAKVSVSQPQKIIIGYRHMIEFVFKNLESGDNCLIPAAFDALVFLTKNEENVILMHKHHCNGMKRIFKTYSSYLRYLPTEMKEMAFGSLEMIFTFENKASPTIIEILGTWFNYLNDNRNNMQFLMEHCRNPFPDVKIAAINLVSVLCLFPWGLTAFKNTAGFLEYLLDRRLEFDAEAKYAKYNVIEILADSEVFDVQTNILLRTYVLQGPHYEEPVMEVVVEGNQ